MNLKADSQGSDQSECRLSLSTYHAAKALFTWNSPAWVAELDAHSTGDQEVAGSTSAGSTTFFHGD